MSEPRGTKRRNGLAIIAGFAASLGLAAAPAPALADWVLPATPISPPQGGSTDPWVAAGPGGGATVVWTAGTNPAQAVEASLRPAGFPSFIGPIGLSSPGTIDNDSARVVSDRSGRTTVAWVGVEGPDVAVLTATRDAASSLFSEPVQVSQEGVDSQGAAIAVGPTGQTTVVWRNLDTERVQAATRAAGANSFSPLVQNVSTSAAATSEQVVTTGSDGTTVAAWVKGSDPDETVQAAIRTPGSSNFGAPADLSPSGQPIANLDVASGPDGMVTAVWRREFPGGGIYRVQTATKGPGESSFSSATYLTDEGLNGPAKVAVGPDGQTTVVWRTGSPPNYTLLAATRPAGSDTFSTPAILSAPGSDAPVYQELDTGPDGVTTVVWNRNNAVWASTRSRGQTGFSAARRLSSTGQETDDLELATSPDARTVVAWGSLGGPMTQATRLPSPRLGAPSVTGPGKARVGKKTTYRVRIGNVGYGVASTVALRAVGRGVKARIGAGSLAGRKSKTVKVPLKFRRKGTVRVVFTVTATNAAKKTVKKVVRVR